MTQRRKSPPGFGPRRNGGSTMTNTALKQHLLAKGWISTSADAATKLAREPSA